MAPQGRNWAAAVKLVKAMEGVEAESARIVIVNYLATALLGTSSDAKAKVILGLLECFKNPYNQSDKLAPLLYSIAVAIDV
jgi:hypothetical protein